MLNNSLQLMLLYLVTPTLTDSGFMLTERHLVDKRGSPQTEMGKLNNTVDDTI